MLGLLLVLFAGAQTPEPLPPLLRGPELLQFEEAEPPSRTDAELRVLLLLEIDAAGAVTRAEVLEGPPGFSEAAAAAALRFRFAPAQDETGPVPVAVEFEYVFPPSLPLEPVELPVSATGQLKEMGTRKPIEGAALQVLAPDGAVLAQARTGPQGEFELRGLPAGSWTLKIRRPDYQDAEEELVIDEGEALTLELWARNLSYRDNEVIVVYERVRAPEVTRRTLSMGEVRRVPGTLGDPVRVIQSLPGAARAPFSGGLLVLRGANPDDSNVYVDGVEVPLVYHLGGFRSILNPDLIEAVDYLPGGYGVRYGRSIGGVVDVRTQDEFPENIRATVRGDLLDIGAYTEGQAGKLGFAIGARRAYIDAVLAVALRNQEYQARPRWMDYQLKLAWLPAAGELSLLVFGFDDQLNVKGEELERQVGVGNSTHRVVFRWEQPITRTLTFSAQPSAGVVGSTISYGTDVRFELDASLLDLRSELAWQPGSAFLAQLGVDSEAARNDFELYLAGRPIDDDNPLSEEEPVDLGRPTWQTTPDPYLQLSFTPLADPEALSFVTGARLAMLSRTNHPTQRALDARASLRARLLPGGTLKVGSGLYHQPPSGIELGRDKAFDEALSAELGWEQQITPAISADVTGFWRKRMDPDTEGSLLEVPADGRAYGTEFMLRHALVDRFFGWVSYTLSRSERTDDPGDPEEWYPYDFDQTHIFTAVAGYRLPLDFEISGRGQYVTGNPYTPFDGGVYLMDEGRWLGFPSADTNGMRQPAYWAVDVRFDKLFTFRKWQLELFLDVLNALHGKNPEFQLNNYDYTETDYVPGLPTLPAFGAMIQVEL